jgi:glycosyltransferase involved in cell wall biosynthesis
LTLIWHIITPEFPPQPGGVSDYTQLVAGGLAAAGDEVHVWCPTEEQRPEIRSQKSEVRSQIQKSEVRGQAGKSKSEVGDLGDQGRGGTLIVHRKLGRFTRSDLRRVADELDQFEAPRRLLVQWVPHGYGYRSMNLHFCLWLWRHARRGDTVEIMVHEPFLSFWEGSWRQNCVAVVHRLMTMILLRAASRVWMTIPPWEALWRPYALGRALAFKWLPVVSNIPVIDDPEGITAIRARYTRDGGVLLGHFGTCDRHIRELLLKSVPALMQNGTPQAVLLLGRGSGSTRAELIRSQPALVDRIYATGTLSAAELSLHVSACDVMLQPYVDGVSSRRTSTMVALAHGVPVVTTNGRLTESLWAESGAVAMIPVEDVSALVDATRMLLLDAPARTRMSAAAKVLYDQRFDIARTITSLRAL